MSNVSHNAVSLLLSGFASFANVEFDFDMRVSRVAEHPRITKPFSDDSWDALNALGQKVDADLKAHDVRLTMGGEPTFVSIDDMDGAQWNTEAHGEHKRALAGELTLRLKNHFAPGGMLHYGQGKWYPGESLPRWTFSLYWRADGKPIWQDESLIARERQQTGATNADAETLLGAIAEHLGVGNETIAPAYEDPGEWLLKEAKLPDNVDPINSELEDAEARSRMKTVFERGLTNPTGYVLPVQRWNAAASSPWLTRSRTRSSGCGRTRSPTRPRRTTSSTATCPWAGAWRSGRPRRRTRRNTPA